MSSMNRATLVGRVGKDPEIRTLTNGDKVANLSLATSEKWKDKSSGERKEKTEWHRVTIWGDGLVGVVEQYVNKGDLLMIEGKIVTRKYEKDGKDHYATEIVVQGLSGRLLMLGSPKGGDSDSGGGGRSSGGSGGSGGGYGDSARKQSHETFSADLDDEIPF